MSSPVDRDPPRWRDRPSTTEGGAAGGADVEREIGAAARSVTAAPGPDELRLAQVRQRALQHAERVRQAGMGEQGVSRFFRWNGGPWRFSRWARLAPVVFVSLLVGGVATAVTGRLIQRYRATPVPPAPAATEADDRANPRSGRHRRWRVTVKSPTDLELAVGPGGAEIAVVEGQANMSGEGITDSVEVLPGKSWKEGDAPLPPLPLPPPPPPSPAPAPVMPPTAAPVPVRTLARAEETVTKVHGNGPRPPPRPDSDGVGTSSGRTGEAAPPSPFEPPPLPPPALPLGPARPAKSSQPRLWGGSDVEPAPGPSAAPVPAPAPSAPVSTVSEATLVARALGRLRREHDPLWALQDLDEHARRFPRGELRREASLARAEALLALDRRTDALAILDGVRLGGAETERRAALARAELRVQEGRHGEAIGDFDRVLAGSAGDALSERALFGRGLCRLRGGDLGGARSDLTLHLERFPTSHRHAEIEKLLGRLER